MLRRHTRVIGARGKSGTASAHLKQDRVQLIQNVCELSPQVRAVTEILKAGCQNTSLERGARNPRTFDSFLYTPSHI